MVLTWMASLITGKNPVSFQKYYLNSQSDTYEDILSLFQCHFSESEKEIGRYNIFTDFIEKCFYREYNFPI